MEFVVVTENLETLAVWQEELGGIDQVDFRVGTPTGFAADAAVMSGIYAFGRYGGRPRTDAAQIRENVRGDGFPGLVVIPPSRPAMFDEEGRPVVRPEFRDTSPAYFAMSHVLRSVDAWDRDHDRRLHSVLLPLPLLGMDDPGDRSTPRSVRRALADHRRERP
jgi:hypothetical protein